MTGILLALSAADFRAAGISGAENVRARETVALEERDAWREAFFEKTRVEDARVASALALEEPLLVAFRRMLDAQKSASGLAAYTATADFAVAAQDYAQAMFGGRKAS
jgi:hypothetical protein